MNDKSYEIIREILDMHQTVEELRFDNRMLKERLAALDGKTLPEQSMTYIEHELIKMGREQVLKDCISYWRGVNVKLDADSGEVVGVQTYESWLDESIRITSLPSWLSLDALKEYFDEDLHETYEKEKEKALAAIHNDNC